MCEFHLGCVLVGIGYLRFVVRDCFWLGVLLGVLLGVNNIDRPFITATGPYIPRAYLLVFFHHRIQYNDALPPERSRQQGSVTSLAIRANHFGFYVPLVQ